MFIYHQMYFNKCITVATVIITSKMGINQFLVS